MSPKRKQQRDEVTGPPMPSTPANIGPGFTALKRQASEDISADSLTSPQPKKAKRNLIVKLKLTRISQSVGKRYPQQVKKPASDKHVAKSTLIPRGERKTAKLGQQDTTLLRMLCDDSLSGEIKELHFRNMPHSIINWDNADHINKINNWRNQIYGRAGLKSKCVMLWLEDEELWFELYFQLSIAEARKCGILLPKTITILQAFNKTFVGRVLKDHHGKDTEPRVQRHSNAFASKFNRMCQHLKTRLNQCVFGKSGDIFVPTITLKMLQAYKQIKMDMQQKDILVESAYADGLEEWAYLFTHLPDANDVEMQDEPFETNVDEDAATTLLSLYSSPVVHQEEVQGEVEDDLGDQLAALQQEAKRLYNESVYAYLCWYAAPQTTPIHGRYDVAAWLATPPLSSASSSSSQGSYYRPTTPVYAMDISALIASPD